MTSTATYNNLQPARFHDPGAATGTGAICNIGSHLSRMAARMPDEPAVIVARARRRGHRYRQISFAELERLSNRYAEGLRAAGLARGMRVLLMVRPGFDFVALVFAMLKLGAVPVMIDPGMGLVRLLDCVRRIELDAFVGIPLAQVMRVLRPGAFRGVRCVVTVGRKWFWGGTTLGALAEGAADEFEAVDTRADDTAAILFTSGSTGPAKGVVYEHGTFDAQIRMIQSQYGIEPGEVDLAAFPLFGLFSVAMGMTAVIPDMDASRPGRVEPENIVRPVLDQRATSAFGSPAVWRKVAPYCIEKGIKLPTLRRVLIAGAPVPWQVIEQLHRVIADDGEVHTPYGATESLPVASISGRELLTVRAPSASDGPALSALSARGGGTCVGRPVPGIDLRLIRISDEAIERWSDDLVVPDGELGEITVAGPVVTEEYYGLPEATRLAKIPHGDTTWHRIGDVGYRDAEGRVWFCGRKSHRVVTEHGTMFTECCEPIFNEHPAVARSALVGVGPKGRQRPVLIVELDRAAPSSRASRTALREELLALARKHERTRPIDRILFHPSLPVDIRHNAKINREQLATWADGRSVSPHRVSL